MVEKGIAIILFCIAGLTLFHILSLIWIAQKINKIENSLSKIAKHFEQIDEKDDD